MVINHHRGNHLNFGTRSFLESQHLHVIQVAEGMTSIYMEFSVNPKDWDLHVVLLSVYCKYLYNPSVKTIVLSWNTVFNSFKYVHSWLYGYYPRFCFYMLYYEKCGNNLVTILYILYEHFTKILISWTLLAFANWLVLHYWEVISGGSDCLLLWPNFLSLFVVYSRLNCFLDYTWSFNQETLAKNHVCWIASTIVLTYSGSPVGHNRMDCFLIILFYKLLYWLCIWL